MAERVMRRRSAVLAVLALVVCAALPIVGARLRRDAVTRCDYDGVRLEALHRVVLRVGTRDVTLCCVACAESWITAEAAHPDSIGLFDETTGAAVDARDAFFVVSRIVAVPETDDRTHVFASETDAEAHASAHRGRILRGNDRPFAPFLSDR